MSKIGDETTGTTKQIVHLPLTMVLEPAGKDRNNIDNEGIEELARSISRVGLLQPILVRAEGKYYRIEAGHRRYLAVQKLMMPVIDAIILPETEHEQRHLERAHENLIRENLNPVEEARLVKRLVYDQECGVDEVARLLSKSETWVINRMEILTMPQSILNALELGEINVSVAQAIAKCKDTSFRLAILENARNGGATAATIKRWISDQEIGIRANTDQAFSLANEPLIDDAGEITLRCGVCGIPHAAKLVRHVWTCTECCDALMVVSRMVREEIAQKKEEELKENATQAGG